MRQILMLAALVVATGCAGQPAAKAPVKAEPAVTFVATEKPEATTLDEARKLGYNIVDEGGQTLYCRTNRKLGSRIHTETICLTEQEMLAAREASQRNFDNMKKAIPPPQGN